MKSYTVTIDFEARDDATARLITLALSKQTALIAGLDASVHGPEPLPDPIPDDFPLTNS